MAAGRRLQDQARPGERLEDAGPDLQGRCAGLGKLVEAAEGDEALFDRR
jgi:hypothetical protein